LETDASKVKGISVHLRMSVSALIVHPQGLLQLFCDFLIEFDLLLKKDLMGGFDVFNPLLMECVHLCQ